MPNGWMGCWMFGRGRGEPLRLVAEFKADADLPTNSPSSFVWIRVISGPPFNFVDPFPIRGQLFEVRVERGS
jgi:hypothetical protein